MFDQPSPDLTPGGTGDRAPFRGDTVPLALPPPPPPPVARRSSFVRAVQSLVIIVLLLVGLGTSLFVGLGGDLATLRSPSVRTSAYWRNAAQTAVDRAVAAVAEEPALGRLNGAARTPFCDDVAADDRRPIVDAINLMRRTPEGERLFRQLVAEGVCIRTGDIPYNSGYAYVVKSFGNWSNSYIKIASHHVEADEPDVLAALLVHEAAHVDRYLSGEACSYDDSCTLLDNGVELEEEIAAHTAEAEWWIQAYGRDGKRFAIGYDFGENELVKAYLEGPDAFAAYVSEIRGDPRELSDQ